MKKVIIVIVFSIGILNSNAQNIDTVIVRNLTMQAQDWAYLVGSYNPTADSIAMVDYRRIRTKVQQAIPPSWTTNMTVDSLHGKTVMEFYQMVKGNSAGEIVSRYTAIVSAITAKTNLAYWIGFVDAGVLNEFNRRRDRGKNLLID